MGAGVAGLTAGYELTKAGHEAVLFEAAPRVGGLAAGFRADHWDWHLEHFYHHLFKTDYAIRGLVDEIGFGDKLFYRNPVTAQWHDGRIFPLDGSNPLEAMLNVLRFPALSFVDRIRYGIALAYLKYGTSDWHKLEQITAAEWAQRWMGERAYRDGIQPLLRGKFGPYAEKVSAAWLWARFRARTFELGYFEGGFQAFVDALADRVRGQGGTIHLSTPVQSITPAERGQPSDGPGPALGLRTEDLDETFDAVIATVSPALLMRMAPDLPRDYLSELRELKSLGAVVMVVAMDRQITENTYWLNLDKREFPFLAYVEHTNFIEAKHYGGDHVAYLGDYLPTDHRYFSMDADELFEVFRPALARLNPDFGPEWVRQKWLFKAGYAQPVVPLNYSQHIPPLETPLPGLYFASMAQVYPWDRGTNYAVEIGQRVADRVTAGTQERDRVPVS